MPLITASHDSLPYIDAEPTPSQRASAQALIDASLPTPLPTTHPLLPPFPTSRPTTAMQAEYTRIESQMPLSGIDLARYESLPDDLPADVGDADAIFRQALVSATYLRLRQERLLALERDGKGHWLGHNESLVGVLTGLERELEATKEGIDRLAFERQAEQEGVKGQLLGLEESWKRGVGRVVETEIAAESMRGEVLAARRAGR